MKNTVSSQNLCPNCSINAAKACRPVIAAAEIGNDILDYIKSRPKINIFESPTVKNTPGRGQLGTIRLVPEIIGRGANTIIVPCRQNLFRTVPKMCCKIYHPTRGTKAATEEDMAARRCRTEFGCAIRQRNLQHLMPVYGFTEGFIGSLEYIELMPELTPLRALASDAAIGPILRSRKETSAEVVLDFIWSGMEALEEAQQARDAYLDQQELSAGFEVSLNDVKIDNMFLDEMGNRVVLGDYDSMCGVPGDGNVIQKDAISTTPAYAAPEMKKNFASNKCDVYMLGQAVTELFGPIALSSVPNSQDAHLQQLLSSMLREDVKTRASRQRLKEMFQRISRSDGSPFDGSTVATYLTKLSFKYLYKIEENKPGRDALVASKKRPIDGIAKIANVDAAKKVENRRDVLEANTTTLLPAAMADGPLSEDMEKLIAGMIDAERDERGRLFEQYLRKRADLDSRDFVVEAGRVIRAVLQGLYVRVGDGGLRSIDEAVWSDDTAKLNQRRRHLFEKEKPRLHSLTRYNDINIKSEILAANLIEEQTPDQKTLPTEEARVHARNCETARAVVRFGKLALSRRDSQELLGWSMIKNLKIVGVGRSASHGAFAAMLISGILPIHDTTEIKARVDRRDMQKEINQAGESADEIGQDTAPPPAKRAKKLQH